MLILLIIIINILAAIIIYLWMFTKKVKEHIKVNKKEHMILSKNDKSIAKDLQTFYTKQLKISEKITTLISITKLILQQLDTLDKNEFYKERTKLESDISKLKNINSSLLEEIAKLKHKIEENNNELEKEREE